VLKFHQVAGKSFWVLTSITGSSFPTYFPAMLWSLVVEAATICSPVALEKIDSTTNLPGSLNKIAMS
jgi:hypothetical protein